MRATLDMTSAALGQPVGPGGQSSSMSAVNAPLLLTKLTDEARERLRGAALSAVADAIMQKDDNFPTDEAGIKNYRRRIRAYAFDCVQKELAAAQKSSMTLAEMNARKEALGNAGKFAEAVITRATRMAALSSVIDVDALERDSGIDLNQEFEADIDQDGLEHEVDAEEAFPDSHDGDTLTLRATGIEFEPSQDLANIPYADFATSLMEIIMGNTMTKVQKPWKDRSKLEKTCSLCIADETMSEAKQAKTWGNADALYDHQHSIVHSPFNKWVRRQTKLKADGKFPCPYCDNTYSRIDGLNRHVKDSTAETDGEEHEAMKTLDGFYESDFFGQISRKGQRERMKTNLKKMEAGGYTFPVKKPIDPRPHEEWPHVWRGPYEPSGYIPEHLEGRVFPGDMMADEVGVIPEHHQQYIARGSDVVDKQIGYIAPRFATTIISGAEAKKRKLAAMQAES